MVRMRNLVKVGNREVKKRYIGNKLIFEDLGDKTEILSGEEIYTDKADDSVVHVEIDGKSYQEDEPNPDNPSEIHSLNDFDVVSQKSEGGMIDKINLLLSEPLRSVGNVKDRLFRDSDGLWKVERNVGEVVVDGEIIELNTEVDNLADKGGRAYFVINDASNLQINKNAITSHFISNWKWINFELTFALLHLNGVYFYYPYGFLSIQKETTKAEREIIINDWLKDESQKGTPLTVQYQLDTPTIEPLSQSLQDKLNNLRSFQESSYVYTVINDKTDILPTVAENLKPTLHATFKSKGWYDYYLKTLLK